MSIFNWTCPFCDRAQVVSDNNHHTVDQRFYTGKNAEGILGLRSTAITCASQDCLRTTVDFKLYNWHDNSDRPLLNHLLFSRRLVPEGQSKSLPSYIPKAIRDDYREACLIRDLSPKASATLARRCLQGMIRDFAKPATKSDKLFEEIKALEGAIADGSAPREISSDSVAALTAVRKVGNIGAHMEANVDVIVDVDAGEAQVLIDLIESLIQDWYIERHKRQQRFAATTQLAVEKDKQIKDARAGQKALAAPDPSGQGAAGEPVA